MEVKHLEVLLMDQGEIICAGKTLGWASDKVETWTGTKTLGDFLKDPEETN